MLPARPSRRCHRLSHLSLLLLAMALHRSPAAHAQASAATKSTPGSTPESTYDPRLTFAPLTLPDPVNAYRSGDGAPGPSYWQNEAD